MVYTLVIPSHGAKCGGISVDYYAICLNLSSVCPLLLSSIQPVRVQCCEHNACVPSVFQYVFEVIFYMLILNISICAIEGFEPVIAVYSYILLIIFYFIILLQIND